MSDGVETQPMAESVREDEQVIAAQMGRSPRRPYRVASRCSHGFPTTLASPAVLEDGSLFPTTYWLTCPHLIQLAGQQESAGMCKQWSKRLATDEQLAGQLGQTDAALRAARAAESGDVQDACASTGIAGQRDILGVKCLHAHTALALAGLGDPIGAWVLGLGAECTSTTCGHLQ